MKIFVTGGTGFLGMHVVRRLLRDGHHVCCLARRGSDIPTFRASVGAEETAGHLRVVIGSLAEIESARESVRNCDVVIHAAAAMRGCAAGLFLNNVIATRRLMALLAGSAVKRFVLISSLSVYGTSQLGVDETLNESCPLDPEPHRRDAYSYSKVAQEHVAWEAYRRRELPLVIIRPGVIYGPGRGTLSARIGLRAGRMLVRMGGGQHVPYTYVENCADAIVAAATAVGIEGHAFNIVDDDLPTALSVLKQYLREAERLRVVPVPHWAIGAASGLCEWYHRWSNGQLPAVLTRYKSAAQWSRLRYDNGKAKTGLAWTPLVTFAQGLRLSNAWSRTQLMN